MCSITGAVSLTPVRVTFNPSRYIEILTKAVERGRDSWGIATQSHSYRSRSAFDPTAVRVVSELISNSWTNWVIGINRGEPTTENVEVASTLHGTKDLPPFIGGPWKTVHNGTIVNDHELANEFDLVTGGIDSRVLPFVLGDIKPWSAVIAEKLATKVKGSYALAAGHSDGTMVLACNYKPIFTAVYDDVLYFASLPHHLPHPGVRSTVQKMDPYSVMVIRDGRVLRSSLFGHEEPKRTLVVLSGGMDSTTVLAKLVHDGEDVAALHIPYGAHAADREAVAVQKICGRLGVELHVLHTDALEKIGGSTLLASAGDAITSGKVGSEYAHEWVPARNLILASLAVGFAEARGYNQIALGNNLEESGSHPDNEQEFIRALNLVLPNAVQEGKRMRFIEPVGNLMKHEIVRLALEVGAPLDLTWSCYRGGGNHCGRCGSCYLRANAFRMNGAIDPVPYELEVANHL